MHPAGQTPTTARAPSRDAARDAPSRVGAGATDAALLAEFVGGDREALGRLAARHEAALIGLARGLLGGSTAGAEEAVQEAWVRVIRGAASFRGDAAVKTWLTRIVINRCREMQRRERTRRRHEPDPPDRENDLRPSGELERAVRGLPTEQREAVLLCHCRSMTSREAAAVLGVPEGTLKSRVRLALSRLRRTLRDEDES
ncbi:MAG: RNA polymerase sigma factor [Planctomycetota bacterium]